MPVTPYVLVKVLVTGAMLVTNGLDAKSCRADRTIARRDTNVRAANCFVARRDGSHYGTVCATTQDKVTCKIKLFPGDSSNAKTETK